MSLSRACMHWAAGRAVALPVPHPALFTCSGPALSDRTFRNEELSSSSPRAPSRPHIFGTFLRPRGGPTHYATIRDYGGYYLMGFGHCYSHDRDLTSIFVATRVCGVLGGVLWASCAVAGRCGWTRRVASVRGCARILTRIPIRAGAGW